MSFFLFLLHFKGKGGKIELRLKLNKIFRKEYTSLVGVYLFRVTIFLAKIISRIWFVSQQSGKSIFTGVVSFCGAALFLCPKNIFLGVFI